jgi:DNA-binding CsgD family transcriptional regulator
MVIEERIAKSQTLYDLGKNDAEIARELNCNSETIRQWRIKNDYPKNFKYSNLHKINVEILKELVENGFKDSEIANMLKVSVDGVYASRLRNNIQREPFNIAKNIEATERQRAVLIGCLLGDGSLLKGKNSINPRFKCEHGVKQKEYCFYKYEILKSLNMNFKYCKRSIPDKRNGIFYESYYIESLANPYYLEIYNNLYFNKTKKITEYILKDFNEESLAIMFMDDGCKINKTISIATNCFSKEELILFTSFLKFKFNLNFTITKTNTIYLKTEDLKIFIAITFPYLHESMYYKIGLQII